MGGMLQNGCHSPCWGSEKMGRTVPILPAYCFVDLRAERDNTQEINKDYKSTVFSDWGYKLQMDGQRKTQSCSLQHSRS